MLCRSGRQGLAARSGSADVRVLAGRAEKSVSALLVNYTIQQPSDRVIELHLANLRPGAKRLLVWRVDQDRKWCSEALELKPVECRDACTAREFQCQILLPADSVAMVSLTDSPAV